MNPFHGTILYVEKSVFVFPYLSYDIRTIFLCFVLLFSVTPFPSRQSVYLRGCSVIPKNLSVFWLEPYFYLSLQSSWIIFSLFSIFYPTKKPYPSLSTALPKYYPMGSQGVAKPLNLGRTWLPLGYGMATPLEVLGLSMPTTYQVRLNTLRTIFPMWQVCMLTFR